MNLQDNQINNRKENKAFVPDWFKKVYRATGKLARYMFNMLLVNS